MGTGQRFRFATCVLHLVFVRRYLARAYYLLWFAVGITVFVLSWF